ncbi:ABC transporter substrate-binding protein [Microbacterium aquimaris]|uniref:Sugar ABC transporter substrate-binding protein n=1 Tax=Microbacterium aquimaris TaxID=459816 RepID=A0ABU5N402_9MICO|nr:sugar ABC transporter substrate-binding protein [Microbacterium aquimaris]MDZ8160837.1 sugar ABC transporter substrate-binding protein [Microbacterium aquimaris]
MATTRKSASRLVAGTGALALAVSLAACSTGGESSPTDDSDPSEASGEIRVGMIASLTPQFEEYAKVFEESHPDIKVTVQSVAESPADYIQQLATENLSDSVPDVLFNTGGLNQTLDSNGLLWDMSEWLEEGRSGLDSAEFSPNFLGLFETEDGRITGLPVSADSGVIVYNIDQFEKYGAELPTDDWTYEEMYDAARTIYDGSGGDVYGIVTPLGVAETPFQWYPVIRAYGSDMYDEAAGEFIFADAAGIEAWTTLLEPYTDGFGVPYSALANDPGKNLFPSEQAAMEVASTARIAALREQMQSDWDVAPMPIIDGVRTTGGGAYSLSLSEKSENKSAAWEFLAWFYSVDGGFEAAKDDGVIPATTDGIENGTWQQDPPPVPSNFVPAVQISIEDAILQKPYPADVAPEVLPALQEAIQMVMLRDESIEVAFTAAQDELNALLP